MTTHIHSINQLRTEKARLQLEKSAIEYRLKNHFKTVTTSVRPANLIKSALGSLASDSEVTGAIKTKGTEAAIGLIMSQLMLKNTNPVIRAVVGVVGSTLATTLLGGDASRYVEKVKSLYRKYKSRHSEKVTPEFDEDDIYTS
jgi:hypothetical protein